MSQCDINSIERTVLSAIVEGRIEPGAKLSENELASAFSVSRTMIREALSRLAARHILSVQARKGWFVNVPDATEAAEVYAARRVVECGFLANAQPFDDSQIDILRQHLDAERQAIDAGDKAALTYLMGEFHVRILEQSGNATLVEILRNLAVRTNLISLRFQSRQDALSSHSEHLGIFEALAQGNMPRAAQLSREHLDHVEAGIKLDDAPQGPIEALRNSLRLGPIPSDGTEATSRSDFLTLQTRKRQHD